MQVKTLGVLLAFAAATAAHAQAPDTLPQPKGCNRGLPWQVLLRYNSEKKKALDACYDEFSTKAEAEAESEALNKKYENQWAEFFFFPSPAQRDASQSSAPMPDWPMPLAKGPPGKSAKDLDLVGRLFKGTEDLEGYGDVRFSFYRKNNKNIVRMEDADGTTEGYWETTDQAKNTVTLQFYDRSVIYTGTLKDGNLRGDAYNLESKWTWSAKLTVDESTPKKNAPRTSPALPYPGRPGSESPFQTPSPGALAPIYQSQPAGATQPGVPSAQSQSGKLNASTAPPLTAANSGNNTTAKPAPGQTSFNPRLVFDESAPKTKIAHPGGVAMPIGIDQTTLQRSSAPSSLIDAIRNDKK